MKKKKVGTLTSDPDRPPLCECHSYPMKHGDLLEDGRYRWRCRIKDAERQRRFRAKKKAQGYCLVCMVTPARLGESHCSSCRNRNSVYTIDQTITKYSTLLALDKDDPEYIAIIRKETSINA